MSKNTAHFSANYTHKITISVHKYDSPDLIFEIIKNQSSAEPYHSPQSYLANSDNTIFRGSHQSCSLKKVFLKMLQNSQESTYIGVSFFIKLQAWALQIYWKSLRRSCFSVNLGKFLRTHFLPNTSGRLIL